jgi:hypothetical protein
MIHPEVPLSGFLFPSQVVNTIGKWRDPPSQELKNRNDLGGAIKKAAVNDPGHCVELLEQLPFDIFLRTFGTSWKFQSSADSFSGYKGSPDTGMTPPRHQLKNNKRRHRSRYNHPIPSTHPITPFFSQRTSTHFLHTQRFHNFTLEGMYIRNGIGIMEEGCSLPRPTPLHIPASVYSVVGRR